MVGGMCARVAGWSTAGSVRKFVQPGRESSVPGPGVLCTSMATPGAHHAMHHRQAQAQPRPTGLVVKTAFKMRDSMALSMPGPAVAHLRATHRPGRQAQALAQAGRARPAALASAPCRVCRQWRDGVGTGSNSAAPAQPCVTSASTGGRCRGRAPAGRWHGGSVTRSRRSVSHHLGHVHGAALQRLVAAEGEDLPHQIACAAPGFQFRAGSPEWAIAHPWTGIGPGQLDVAQMAPRMLLKCAMPPAMVPMACIL